MSKYDELKKLAQAVMPETEEMGSYVGEHKVLVGAEQKMRSIVVSYFGPGSYAYWEFREHGSALACIKDYDKWLRTNRLVVVPRQVLDLIAENERLRNAIGGLLEWVAPIAGDNQDDEASQRELDSVRVAEAAMRESSK